MVGDPLDDALWDKDADPEALEEHYTRAVSLLTDKAVFAKCEVATVIALHARQLAEAQAEIERLKKQNVFLAEKDCELALEVGELRAALEEISRMGPCFDAKGTRSQMVVDIARRALSQDGASQEGDHG